VRNANALAARCGVSARPGRDEIFADGLDDGSPVFFHGGVPFVRVGGWPLVGVIAVQGKW
jgi:hypothetical protein